MQRIAAQRLVPEAPAELAALLLRERAADGATRRLCAAGDVGFSGRLAAVPAGNVDPFREVAPVLRGADLAFANLETPLVGDDPGGRLFAASTAAAAILAAAGFRLLNLANNHILDHGPEGLASTRFALGVAGIETLGAGADAASAQRLVVTDLGALRLGWLGCGRTLQCQEAGTEGFWEYDPRELEAAVREARGSVDVLAVSIHMGYMFVDYPHPEQRRQVLAILAAGADLVLLHHAHVLQGIESTGDGMACYSLGNLLLDWQEGEVAPELMIEEQRSGGLFVFDLDRRGVCRAAVLPLVVDDTWTVRWATGDAGRAILDRVERASDWRRDTGALFHRQLAERATGLALRTLLREARRGKVRALIELLPRLRPHHLRMVSGWLGSRLRRRVRGDER